MNIVAIVGAVSLALAFVIMEYKSKHDERIAALESKATAPVENPPYVGEFAAERIAGRVRTHCEWKERTERTASLHCVYVKPKEAK